MKLCVRFAMAFCLLTGTLLAADEDAVAKKLAAAKGEYEKSLVAARGKLAAAVQKKADAARSKGDLVELQQLEEQLRTLESGGKLPSAVPTQPYHDVVRKARTKLEEAYAAAVQQYTKEDAREKAVATLAQLDEFELAGAKGGYDPYLPGVTFVYKSASGEIAAEMAVVGRSANNVQLKYTSNTIIAVISSKQDGGVLRWAITDAKAERGAPFSGSLELAPGLGRYKVTSKFQSGNSNTRDFVRKGL